MDTTHACSPTSCNRLLLVAFVKEESYVSVTKGQVCKKIAVLRRRITVMVKPNEHNVRVRDNVCFYDWGYKEF